MRRWTITGYGANARGDVITMAEPNLAVGESVVVCSVEEIERWLREWQDDWNEGAMVPPPADGFMREFGGSL